MRKYWPILSSDLALNDASFKKPPRFVYKCPPNICDLVVRADQPHVNPPPPSHLFSDGNYRCAHSAQCKCTSFNHPHTGKMLKIKRVITCNTKNVIHRIKYPCGLMYIGKTTRCLKTRIAKHIRLNDEKHPVAVHLNAFRHNLSSLRYIEQVSIPRRAGWHRQSPS